ncbi:hypothetical protein CKAN_00757900 [Cinnamomum micranthum f. kanehirae]|uniref:Uncharacterized protein n=1 Tax=Cinnamomum micranthum f. kanehirae TaxID=337451 RepID=A0A3S3Q5E3_9MAGN|nr:hypothetical protein CKAN_00757900 [Cinnamomum micranthum f. kanehirae]
MERIHSEYWNIRRGLGVNTEGYEPIKKHKRPNVAPSSALGFRKDSDHSLFVRVLLLLLLLLLEVAKFPTPGVV